MRMYLLIDISDLAVIQLFFFQNEKSEKISFFSSHRKLLVSINEALGRIGITYSSLAGVAVVMGVGSFTSARLAATVANTLSYTLGIPVLAVDAETAKDIHMMEQQMTCVKPRRYIYTTYSGSPHIRL